MTSKHDDPIAITLLKISFWLNWSGISSAIKFPSANGVMFWGCSKFKKSNWITRTCNKWLRSWAWRTY